jgi:hypothetical protein
MMARFLGHQWEVNGVSSVRVRLLFALVSAPLWSRAGVMYDVAIRPVDESNISLAGKAPIPVVTQYFVEGGKVRVGGTNAKQIYIFKERTMYVVDPASRVVHVLKHATLRDVTAHYTDTVKQLENAAAAAAPEERAAAEQKAADMKTVSDRILHTVPHEFSLTVRYESVDGHACRIWEERENSVKRLELCVAPTVSLSGGAEILNGMKTLSQFRQGSDFAFGVDFGFAEWWSDIASLGGVPLLIREYKYDTVVSEVMVSDLRQGVSSAQPFDLPEGYPLQEGPDYVQWYAH